MMLSTRQRLSIGAVMTLGLLSLLQYWLGAHRPASLLRADIDFVVTSSFDRGPGSLREAIFAADTARQRARIVLRPTQPIHLETSLPPLVNPLGIILESDSAMTVEIDAKSIENGPVFDIAAPYSVIRGFKITDAQEQAVLTRADGVRLSQMTFADCDTGVAVASAINDFVLEDSRFAGSRLGISLASDNGGVIIRNNQFREHRDAAIWAVQNSTAGTPVSSAVEIRSNRFESDRLGLVLGNVPAHVEGNEFVHAKEAALYLIGEGAVVRGNRIRDGAGIGIFAHQTKGAVIQSNEIDHNVSLAVLVRSAQNNLVEDNKLYDNGYGIASVLGSRTRPNVVSHNEVLSQRFDGIILIGDSPVIRGNSMMRNQLAGIRILDFLPTDGERVNSDPFLGNNQAASNKFNEPIHGEYRFQSR